MTKNPDAATQAFEWLPLNEALAKYPKGHPYWDSVVNPGSQNDYDYGADADAHVVAARKYQPIWATWTLADTQQRDPEQRIRALYDFFQNFEVSGPHPSAEFMAMFSERLQRVVSLYDDIAAEREKLDRLEDNLHQIKEESAKAKAVNRATVASAAAKQSASDDSEKKRKELESLQAAIERKKSSIKDAVKYASLDRWLGIAAPSETKGMQPPNVQQIAAIAHAADIAPKGTKESKRNAAARRLGYRHRPATLPSTISNYKSKIRDWKEENGKLIPPPMLPLEVATEVAESANRRAEEKKRALRDWAENLKNDEG